MSLKNYNTLKSIVKKDPFSVLRMDEGELSVPILRYALKLEPKLVFSIEGPQMTSMMAEAIAREVPRYLNMVPMRLRTLEVCELAIEYREILKITPISIMTDDFVDEALGHNPLGVEFLKPSWLNEKRVRQLVIDDAKTISFIDKSWHNPELAMICAKTPGDYLSYFSENIFTDEIIDQALISYPRYISLISDKWLTEDRVKFAINRLSNGHWDAFHKIPESLLTNDVLMCFLKKSLTIISLISTKKLKELVEQFAGKSGGEIFPQDMASALKLLSVKNSSETIEFAIRYLAAMHKIEDFRGASLSAYQVVKLSPYFDTQKLLSVIKTSNIDKKHILGDQLGL